MLNNAAQSSIVIDRESDQQKGLDASDPRIRLPPLWLVASQGRPLVLLLRAPVEHVRYGRRLPSLSSPVDFNAVLEVWRLVAALGLVCSVTRRRSTHGKGQRVVSESRRHEVRYGVLPQPPHPHGSATAFADELKRLKGLGLQVETARHAWVHWRSLYVTDPEGNQVRWLA